MKAKSVEETLALYDVGVVTHGEMLAMLLRLVTPENVDELIASLPGEVHDDFITWVRRHYGGELADEGAIHIGGEGYDPPPGETVLAVRAWLARNPQ